MRPLNFTCEADLDPEYTLINGKNHDNDDQNTPWTSFRKLQQVISLEQEVRTKAQTSLASREICDKLSRLLNKEESSKQTLARWQMPTKSVPLLRKYSAKRRYKKSPEQEKARERGSPNSHADARQEDLLHVMDWNVGSG